MTPTPDAGHSLKPAAAVLEAAVDELVARTRGHLVVAAPLGLGKPHRLLNALYRRVAANPGISLEILTALSLDPPNASSALEARFLDPFVARHFGEDFPRLDYTVAQQRDALPPNIWVEEFYLQSGAMLGSSQAQRSYTSLDYTHVARAVSERGINVLVQKVAREPAGSRLSLSCNPDITFDLLDAIAARGLPRPLTIAEVDPQLPFIGGSAAVDIGFFDVVIDLPGPTPKLFALPRQAVSDTDFAIGLHASTLVKDGGMLQIGIGSLSDALCHALILRHKHNAAYLEILESLSPGLAASPLVRRIGGTSPFVLGLHGASEMVNDGFMHLHQAGILKRRVIDDIEAMRRINAGTESAEDRRKLETEGHWLDGAFFLGSQDLYRWLHELPADEARGLGMTRISQINELYGSNETLERLQRRDARFLNTCMMMTAMGSAVSDALADGRVVSGVGGQYNFVAMAHALRDGRSILMFRSTRADAGQVGSNVLWNYGHCTIPRHLRDIAITEYGVADLLGASDEDCIKSMLAITDVRFQADLARQACASKKLAADFQLPAAWLDNTPAGLRAALLPFRRNGLLPEYPFGCDFSDEEQRLVRALAWLGSATRTRGGRIATILGALAQGRTRDQAAMQRMKLQAPVGIREWLDSRLVALALARTAA